LFWQWRLQMGPDELAIREVHSTWIDAVNAGDLVRLLSLMADDVVFLNPGQAPLGKDGFPPGFSAAHQHARRKSILAERQGWISSWLLGRPPACSGQLRQRVGRRR